MAQLDPTRAQAAPVGRMSPGYSSRSMSGSICSGFVVGA